MSEGEDRRYLLSHPESDSLFEVFTWKDAKKALNGQCDDVTNEPSWETQFLAQQSEEKNGNRTV